MIIRLMKKPRQQCEFLTSKSRSTRKSLYTLTPICYAAIRSFHFSGFFTYSLTVRTILKERAASNVQQTRD